MKIAVYTNIQRVFALVHRVRKRCASEVPSVEIAVRMADGMDSWREAQEEADIVLFLWMGTGLDNPFLQQASRSLQKRRARYLILVDNAEHDKVS